MTAAAITLLGLLGSPNYAARESVTRATEAMMPAVMPLVELGTFHRDAEVRARCERIAAPWRWLYWDAYALALLFGDMEDPFWYARYYGLDDWDDDAVAKLEQSMSRVLRYPVGVPGNTYEGYMVGAFLYETRDWAHGRDSTKTGRCPAHLKRRP